MWQLASIFRWLLVGVLVSGCGKSAKECQTEAAALGKLLAEADTEPALLWIPEKIKLPMRTDLPARELENAPVVNLTATEITYQGQLVPDRDALRERLVAAHAEMKEQIERGYLRSKPPNPELVYFVIDEGTPWRRTIEMVKAADDAGMRAPVFVFAIPVTSTPPPRAPIDDKLDAILANEDASNKATEFANIMTEQVADCPALQQLFGAIASEEGKSKSQTLIEGIPTALIECKCDVHMGNFRSAMWRLLANPRPTRVIAFDPAATKQTIALPAATPWSEASKRFTAELKFAELVAN